MSKKSVHDMATLYDSRPSHFKVLQDSSNNTPSVNTRILTKKLVKTEMFYMN